MVRMQSAKQEYRCVIDGLWYDSIEAVAVHLRMQHGVKNYRFYVASRKPW